MGALEGKGTRRWEWRTCQVHKSSNLRLGGARATRDLRATIGNPTRREEQPINNSNTLLRHSQNTTYSHGKYSITQGLKGD
jgi:hypothetical protein